MEKRSIKNHLSLRNMKKTASFLTILALFLSIGCRTVILKIPPGQVKTPPGHVKAPPGQVKKATGSQSAKPYAPGQQKKKKNN